MCVQVCCSKRDRDRVNQERERVSVTNAARPACIASSTCWSSSSNACLTRCFCCAFCHPYMLLAPDISSYSSATSHLRGVFGATLIACSPSAWTALSCSPCACTRPSCLLSTCRPPSCLLSARTPPSCLLSACTPPSYPLSVCTPLIYLPTSSSTPTSCLPPLTHQLLTSHLMYTHCVLTLR